MADLDPLPYRTDQGTALIELRLNSLAQLFNVFDPSPFHRKDLDRDAEDYIVGALRELGPRPARLVLQLPEAEAATAEARELGAAILPGPDHRPRPPPRASPRPRQPGHRPPLPRRLPAAAPARPLLRKRCGRVRTGRGPADRRLGRPLAAARDLSLRLVAASPPAPGLPAPRRDRRPSPAGRRGGAAVAGRATRLRRTRRPRRLPA